MHSWTLWEPRLNSIATHARLWACDADATHPKKRSSSMTSVTGSPTGQDSPDHARASCAANMALPSRVASPCDGLYRIKDTSESTTPGPCPVRVYDHGTQRPRRLSTAFE